MINKSLRQILLKDHGRINNYIQHWISQIENKKTLDFDERKWNLEKSIVKHFYLEEKIVYTTFATGELKLDKTQLAHFNDFICQHNDLFEIITELKIDNHSELRRTLTEFLKSINKHVVFESDNIYRVLDEKTPNKLKESLGSKIEEDHRHGYYPFDKLRDYWREKMMTFGIDVLTFTCD